MDGPAPPLHLHLGPGALGGGLVIAEHDPAAMDLVVVGRTSAAPLAARMAATGHLRVRIGSEEREIPVPELVRGDTTAGRERLVALATAERDLLVTTTVRDGQPAAIDLVLDLLARRAAAIGATARSSRGGPATVVVPCENVRHPRWEEVRATGHAVVARHVLVDRICTQVAVGDDVVVVAEPYREWMVGFNEGDDGALAPRAGMEISDDIVFAARRKLLLVNVVQLAAALLCLDEGRVDMGAFFATAVGDLVLGSLLLECSLVLASEFPDRPLGEILASAARARARLAAAPDDALRIVQAGATGPYDWLVAVYRKMVPRMDEPLIAISRIIGADRLSGSMLGKARLAADDVIARMVEPDR